MLVIDIGREHGFEAFGIIMMPALKLDVSPSDAFLTHSAFVIVVTDHKNTINNGHVKVKPEKNAREIID